MTIPPPKPDRASPLAGGKHDRIGVATPGAHGCNAPPSHKFTPKRRGRAKANQSAKCRRSMPSTTEKTIVSAILCGKAQASNAVERLKRSRGSPIEQEGYAVPHQVDADPGNRHDADGDEPPGPGKFRARPTLRDGRHRRLAHLTFFGSLWPHENLPWPPPDAATVDRVDEPAICARRLGSMRR